MAIGKPSVSRLISALGSQDPEVAAGATEIITSIGLAAAPELRKEINGKAPRQSAVRKC